ncbi:MAG TPA: helix-hairpin-helix domain-containing protein [Pyrinomonadaceae bacterium]|nr:helix-hairpin-helix domain-containing protein [Pyrinomonadaceae bacterium]
MANRRLALFLFLSVASLAQGCVKLPRHTSLATAQTALESSRTEANTAAPGPLVNINTASPAELEKLPGIGEALAARIVAYRRQHGRFRRAEHLIMVRGISERRFRGLRASITVE